MTGFLTFVLVWYMLGAIGCTLGVKSDLSRGIDFKFSDLLMCILISILGVFALILGMCEFSKTTQYTTPVLIKGKK